METRLQQSVRSLSDTDGIWEVRDERLSVMQEATSHIPTLPLPLFPAGVDTRWETTNCLVWNDRERLAEKQELIYEVAWIPELGIWRRFLRSRRKLPS
jgi:hypothetical protein